MMRRALSRREIVLLVALFWMSILGIVTCHAATDLPIVCTKGAISGEAVTANTCTEGKYATPAPTDLVRKGLPGAFVWTPYASVLTGETINVCKDDLKEASPTPIPFNAATDPCKSWGELAKAATSRTGTISLTWGKPDFTSADATPETALTGYKLYSGVKGGALTILKTLPASPQSVSLPGYGAGKYSFAITALYADLESAQTGPVDVEVIIANPKIPKAPTTLSITSVTIQ